MTRDEANLWIENTFSEYTKEEDRQESIYYLVKKIFDDNDNKKSCDGCKSIEDSKTLMKGIIPLECMFCIRKNSDNFKKDERMNLKETNE